MSFPRLLPKDEEVQSFRQQWISDQNLAIKDFEMNKSRGATKYPQHLLYCEEHTEAMKTHYMQSSGIK